MKNAPLCPLRLFMLPIGWLLGLTYSSAQQVYPRLDLQAGDTAWVVQEQDRVYPQAARSYGYVGLVKLGDPVIILEKTPVRADLDDRKHCWYLVSFGSHYQKKGYIFGNALAEASARTPDGSQFLLSVITAESVTQPAQVEVKLLQEDGSHGEIIRLQINLDDTIKVRVYGNRGLQKYKNVVVFTFQNTSCPENFREVALVWDGEDFLTLPLFSPLNGKNLRCYGFKFLFPEDPGGKPGVIIAETRAGNAAAERVKLREVFHGYIPAEN